MPDEAEVETVRLEIRRMTQKAIIITVIVLLLVFLILILGFLPTVVANKWLGDLLLAIDYLVIVSWSSAAMVLILLSAYMSQNLRMGKAIVFSRKEKLQYMLIFLFSTLLFFSYFFISFHYERRGQHIYLVV